MGKKQHQKDKMYITVSEHKYQYGGKIVNTKTPFRALPFDRCALGLTAFETPVCTKDGTVFEILNIMPYLKKHGKNPVTGEPLTARDLIRLHFHKNTLNQYWCPVTFKVFTPHSHIVAIRPTGNVFSWEAIQSMNIKPNVMEDLLDSTPFTKADIITIQDPENLTGRDLTQFKHVKDKAAADAKFATPDEPEEGATVRANAANSVTRRILAQVAPNSAAVATEEKKAPSDATSNSSSSSSSAAAASSPAAATTAVAVAEPKKEAAKRKPEAPKAEETGPKKYRAAYSSGAVSTSFTSTAITPTTKNERAILSDDQVRELRYAQLRNKKKSGTKAYARIVTSLGNINVILHADISPRAVHNFLLLAERKYYDGTTFHRLIPGFMIQGGDPEGSGRGGKSAWDKPFKDEFDTRLRHDARGMLCMANSGKDTNGSQFYFTFGAAPHLDNKHTIFGQVAGGMEVLDAMEAAETGSGKKKETPETPIVIREVIGYNNPFNEEFVPDEEYKTKKQLEEEKKEAEMDNAEMGRWFSAPQPTNLVATGSGIGKYLPTPKASDEELLRKEAEAKKQKRAAKAATTTAAAAAATTDSSPSSASSASSSTSTDFRAAFRAQKAKQQASNAAVAAAAAASAPTTQSYGNFSSW